MAPYDKDADAPYKWDYLPPRDWNSGRTEPTGRALPLSVSSASHTPNGSIDLVQERFATPRSLVALDCSASQSDSSGMLTMLIIAACMVGGTIVHHRRHERRGW